MAGEGPRHHPAWRRRFLIAAAAAPLALAGCASTGPSATPRHSGGTAPEAARMVCSNEIRGEVADALNLGSVPAPHATWADHVYTCTYPLPMGPLVLSVTVAPRTAAAGAQLDELRSEIGAGEQEPGLGERAYSTPTGTVLAVKDNMVLRVDATGLPDDLGVTHERRVDLARVIAAGVFNCWTGSS
jgi:hypothetical protein